MVNFESCKCQMRPTYLPLTGTTCTSIRTNLDCFDPLVWGSGITLDSQDHNKHVLKPLWIMIDYTGPNTGFIQTDFFSKVKRDQLAGHVPWWKKNKSADTVYK